MLTHEIQSFSLDYSEAAWKMYDFPSSKSCQKVHTLCRLTNSHSILIPSLLGKILGVLNDVPGYVFDFKAENEFFKVTKKWTY